MIEPEKSFRKGETEIKGTPKVPSSLHKRLKQQAKLSGSLGPSDIEVRRTQRMYEAWKLKKEGMNAYEIAEEMQQPVGNINRWLSEMVEKVKKVTFKHVEDFILLELAVMDEMMQIAMKMAKSQDRMAIETVLRISERRSKLLGLDAPDKLEILHGQKNAYAHLSDEDLMKRLDDARDQQRKIIEVEVLRREGQEKKAEITTSVGTEVIPTTSETEKKPEEDPSPTLLELPEDETSETYAPFDGNQTPDIEEWRRRPER